MSASKPSMHQSLAELPHRPASDLKKAGWRAIMTTVRNQGKVVVTNHDEPEAVILSAAEYEAIMKVVREAESKTELALESLRQRFDERLAGLQSRSASAGLRAAIRSRASLGGKVKAGTRS